jgi:hypothetical protein
MRTWVQSPLQEEKGKEAREGRKEGREGGREGEEAWHSER